VNSLDRKIREVFPEESVFKDESVNAIFGSGIPSFIKDWLISRFTDSATGEVDKEGIKTFLDRYIPRGENARKVKGFLVNNPYVPKKVLARIMTEPDVKSGVIRFQAPELGIKLKEGVVSQKVLTSEGGDNLSFGEFWGVCELTYLKEEGYIELSDFKPFKPYEVNLDYYREAREEFTLEEWIDLLIKSMEFNPEAMNLDQKILLLARLTPFVEPNLNVIELAPKGTGKSYVFQNLSKYGLLLSGGYVSRAKLFYDLNRNVEGAVKLYDYIALDEIQTIRFSDEEEIRGILKSYLESGTFNIGHYRGNASAGFVILGNIQMSEERRPAKEFFFEELPDLFKESALLDRFHGFIEGWFLPRFTTDLRVKGFALNVEFFSDILHQMRSRGEYRAYVEELISVPPRSDARDKKAIVKLTTAMLKLLFPNAPEKPLEGEDLRNFKNLCLSVAKRMRRVIKEQLSIVDPAEYSPSVPDIELKSSAV